MGFSIAIDGPAGAGKSTMAKAVAKKLNFIYVDTGAMYRAMALFLIRNQISAQDMDGISSKCQDADITIKYENNEQVIYLNGENVNGLIRTEEVGNMASASSVNKEVRLKLVDLQRKLAQTADVVMDGRDIGTHVLPQAELKIYLTADAGVRAQRRCIELEARGIASDVDRIKRDIMERDERDMTREISPLCQAEDAILIDTSEMSIENAVEAIMQLYYQIK
ncbi:MAG: (d)CMP kinase [Lachnospiraceae bacterium]|nr:(d)CMP kinase [Lachnospiraceae bacterium]